MAGNDCLCGKPLCEMNTSLWKILLSRSLLPSQTPITQTYAQVLETGKAKQPEAFHFNCACAYTNMQKFDKAIEEVDLSLPARPQSSHSHAHFHAIFASIHLRLCSTIFASNLLPATNKRC